MTDLYLKATTETEMNAALTQAGVLVDIDGQLLPAVGVSVDVIGPFTRVDYSVEPPVETYYPDWHVNVRSYDLTSDQLDMLAAFTLVPPETPYRVWA
jgi:hypothetical protein